MDARRLSPHFTLAEMVRSETAAARALANVPDDRQIANLEALCTQLLDPIAEHFGGLIVTSGFRCPVLNVAIGGSGTSSHCANGEAAAADTHPATKGVTLVELVEYGRDCGLPFDQIIYEYGSWVHFSHRNAAGEQRRQVLMKFAKSAYLPFDASDSRVHS